MASDMTSERSDSSTFCGKLLSTTAPGAMLQTDPFGEVGRWLSSGWISSGWFSLGIAKLVKTGKMAFLELFFLNVFF